MFNTLWTEQNVLHLYGRYRQRKFFNEIYYFDWIVTEFFLNLHNGSISSGKGLRPNKGENPQGYVSTCAERLRGGLGTATADGCHPLLYVSTEMSHYTSLVSTIRRERRGSAVARLQQKMEFYPFSFKWFKPCLRLSTITEQYAWNECLTYKIYV